MAVFSNFNWMILGKDNVVGQYLLLACAKIFTRIVHDRKK